MTADPVLGEFLRARREHRRWTLEEAAAKMDLSRQLLGYIERAVRGPSVETCRKIALAYGMEPDDMYERAGHLPPDVVAVIKAQFKPMVTLVRAARNCEPKRIGMMAGRLRRGETL